MRYSALIAPAGAAATALLLTGCISATSEAMTPLSADMAAGGFVKEVYVSGEPESGITAKLAHNMAGDLEDALAKCATGDHPLRVDVMVERAKPANPVLSAVMTDTNEVKGAVTIYSLETGATVGEYDVSWENRGGLGLTGAFMQSAMGEKQVSDGFAREICRSVFEGGEAQHDTINPLPF